MSVMQTNVVICQAFYHAHFSKPGSITNEILLLRGPSGAYLLSLHLVHPSSCFSLSFHFIFLFDHPSLFSITSLQLLFSLSAPFSPDCILKTHTIINTWVRLLCSKPNYQSHLSGSVTGTHTWMISNTNAYVSILHITTYHTDTPFCYVYKVYQNSSIYDWDKNKLAVESPFHMYINDAKEVTTTPQWRPLTATQASLLELYCFTVKK